MVNVIKNINGKSNHKINGKLIIKINGKSNYKY